PASRADSSWRDVPTATSVRTPSLDALSSSQSMGPSGRTSTPATPSRGAASKASARRLEVALVGAGGGFTDGPGCAVGQCSDEDPARGDCSRKEPPSSTPWDSKAAGGRCGSRRSTKGLVASAAWLLLLLVLLRLLFLRLFLGLLGGSFGLSDGLDLTVEH